MENIKKYKKILLPVLGTVCLALVLFLGFALYKTNERLADANRVISAKIDDLQEFDSKLGIAESTLHREKDLREKYESETKAFQKEIAEKTNKINAGDLKLKSREETIAALRRTIKGGSSSVTTVEIKTDPKTGDETTFETIVDIKQICDGKTLAYSWEDKHKRFSLKDPDISNLGDEIFEYKQYIRIKGLVLTDKTGNVQVKKIIATEVIRKETKAGEVSYEPIDGGDLELIDSKFEYTNKEEDGRSLLDIVTLRPFASFDTAVMPGFGLELINLGRFVDYANIGLYGKMAFDVSDPLGGSLQNSRMGLGLNYHIIPPLIPTNFAIGAAISTPFNNIGQVVFTVDLILYLTEDLNPFVWLK